MPADTPPAAAAPVAQRVTEAEPSPAPDLHKAVVAGLGDVLCPLVVEIGRGTLTVQEVVELRRSAILQMTQSAGQDLSLAVNGVTLAKGEVVIVADSTAVRVTEVDRVPGADAQAPA